MSHFIRIDQLFLHNGSEISLIMFKLWFSTTNNSGTLRTKRPPLSTFRWSNRDQCRGQGILRKLLLFAHCTGHASLTSPIVNARWALIIVWCIMQRRLRIARKILARRIHNFPRRWQLYVSHFSPGHSAPRREKVGKDRAFTKIFGDLSSARPWYGIWLTREVNRWSVLSNTMGVPTQCLTPWHDI